MSFINHDELFHFEDPGKHFQSFLNQFSFNIINESQEKDVFFRLNKIIEKNSFQEKKLENEDTSKLSRENNFLIGIASNLASLKDLYEKEAEKLENEIGSERITSIHQLIKSFKSESNHEMQIRENLKINKNQSFDGENSNTIWKNDIFLNRAHSNGKKYDRNTIRREMLKWYMDENQKFEINNLKDNLIVNSSERTEYQKIENQERTMINEVYRNVNQIFNRNKKINKYKRESIFKQDSSKWSKNYELNYQNNVWNQFLSYVNQLQDIAFHHFPYLESSISKQKHIISKFKNYNYHLSKNYFHIDNLFQTLSKQLNQNMSEVFIYKRIKSHRTIPENILYEQLKSQIQTSLHKNEQENSSSNINIQKLIPQLSDIETYRTLFTKAFTKVVLICMKQRIQKENNDKILKEITHKHYNLLLIEICKLIRLRLIQFGEYRLLPIIYLSTLKKKLRQMSTYEQSKFLFWILSYENFNIFTTDNIKNQTDNSIFSKNDINLNLSILLEKHQERLDPNSMHPGFYRLLRKYMKLLLKSNIFQEFNHKNIKNDESNLQNNNLSRYKKIFPYIPSSALEIYKLVEKETQRIIFNKNEIFFKKKYVNEFTVQIPKSIINSNESNLDEALRFLKNTNQIQLEDLSKQNDNLFSSSVMDELFSLAKQKHSLPIPLSINSNFQSKDQQQNKINYSTKHMKDMFYFKTQYEQLINRMNLYEPVLEK